ncbi:MAG: FimB/Mfa2 family fimbrial subunit [Porphyromonas sp.]|nr:FimB/Mfa2 family fimbrial subunit [Porphyromonas sp.]
MSDLDDCPQYTVFTFDVRTPDEISFPDNKIDDVRVFAFDENGQLIGEWIEGEVAFLPGYQMTTEFYRPGQTTTFVAWAAKDMSQYDLSAFKLGAKKEDLVLFMAKQADQIMAVAGPLYVAESKEPLVQENRDGKGTHTDFVHFSFVQITNHFNIQIEGLPAGHQYKINFTAKNSKYTADGTLLPDTPFEWTTETFKQSTNDNGTMAVLQVTYDILRLVPGQKGDYLITITDDQGRVVYQFDPLHDYILYEGAAASGPNPFKDHLDLNHEFNIRIRLEGSNENYMAVQVTIQSWNLVFRNVGL